MLVLFYFLGMEEFNTTEKYFITIMIKIFWICIKIMFLKYK
jgi:hypothetical protein